MPEIKDNIKHKHTIGARGKWYSPLTNCILEKKDTRGK